VKVKLLLVFGALVLVIGLGILLVYLSLTRFFTANASAMDRNRRTVEQIIREPQKVKEATVPEKIEHKAAAKAAN
jgi:Na+-transporting methylmalonyl-CoA/oxaloacetate decarboxylase gamma subunit